MKLLSFLFPNFDTHDSSQPTSHWFQQRLSAFLAIIFGLWFLISIQSMPGLEYTSVRNWLSSFYNALILFFLIIVISYHSNLGIKVIIEDYIHHSLLKNIDKLIAKDTGLPVQIADDPLTCVAIGTGKALEQEEIFSTILTEY